MLRKIFTDDRGYYQPPLSWKLSEIEKDLIQKAWDKVKNQQPEEKNVVKQIQAKWTEWHS